jgi:transcriptional regulator with PAS, ATPase and Fis domain
VSRRHLAIERDEGAIRLVDLDSSNGTFLSGVRIRDAFLSGDDTIRIGSTTLRITADPVPHVAEASEESTFGRVSGVSREMRCLYPVFARLAASDVPILIEGETGTGKEMLAESLHEASARADRPFVVVDCTTMSPSLIDAELFGHERGAFTGAVARRRGLFEEAHSGTLFIDEIGDLEITLQAKLLRALERKEVRRVGGNKWTSVDVRIIAATRRNLDGEVQAQRFRDDLYYRLAVARVELPPLRRRAGDVAFLAGHFWAALGGDEQQLTRDIVGRFERYAWPGNVRELYNAVARQIALGDVHLPRSATTADNSKDFIERFIEEGKPLSAARQHMINEFERLYLTRMLELHDGHVGRAAKACGIGMRYFQKLRAKQ